MRVRISTNPPLPIVKAWFLLTRSAQTIAAFKSTLCTSISVLRGFSPSSLHLSIDGFELLDSSELDILRDGDLICVDALDTTTSDNLTSQAAQKSDASRKRKRPVLSSSSSSSESESESSTETATSTESESSSDGSVAPSVQQIEPPQAHVRPKPSVHSPYVRESCPICRRYFFTSTTFVPPGYGKPHTRLRNIRRRRKRMHERNAANVSQDVPVSGANAIVHTQNGQAPSANGEGLELMSLSLRNKNKAKNFKALINKPLPPKIIFDEHGIDPAASTAASRAMPQLIPPSSRASLPPNMFVTSVDVEANFRREKKKGKMQIDYGDTLEEQAEGGGGEDTYESVMDIDILESIAEKQWDTLEKLTREKQFESGMIVGCKGLGINPETYTPEEMVTVGVVERSDEGGVEVRSLRAVSFSGPVDGEVVKHAWHDIEHGEWRVVSSN